MSDTSGLPNTDAQGVPAEDDPERFEQRGGAPARDARAAESGDGEKGQGEQAPAGDPDGAEPPPADFDPAEQPSNPDLVENVEPPDE